MVILLLTLDLKDTTEVVLVCNLGEALPEGNHACFNADGLFRGKVEVERSAMLFVSSRRVGRGRWKEGMEGKGRKWRKETEDRRERGRRRTHLQLRRVELIRTPRQLLKVDLLADLHLPRVNLHDLRPRVLSR
jgi:hypothetical protein